ncbi:MAG TPA: DNA repair protein RadA [Polyangiaceae bacterium]
MSKTETRFLCQACGAAFPRWLGRCTACGGWNTLLEETTRKTRGKSHPTGSRALPITEIEADASARVPTGIGELDRVLGGGAVLGGVTLVGGDPGVGKSTLLMQALAGLSARGLRTLYVSGEESAGQTATRAKRLGAGGDERMLVLAENELEIIERALDDVKPSAIVVDSVQTVRTGALDSASGTVSQLREVTARFVERAKKDGIATFLVGHVTKDGMLAGPKVLEHLVDTVLSFEGERGHALRTLRAQKNRFGSATEVGVFEMSSEGMREVPNPSALFLAERPRGVPGSVIAATAEGARALLVEVQALVGGAALGNPRRTANGVDGARLAMILAVLDRKVGLAVGQYDVFVNVAGGVRVEEPAMDLAIALALASSLRDRPVDGGLVAFGEIGLAGEVRGVDRVGARLAEAQAMGFKTAVVPSTATPAGAPSGLEVVTVRTLSEAVDRFL